MKINSYYKDSPESPNGLRDQGQYYSFVFTYQPNEGLRSFGESAKQLNETITAASAISEYNGQIQEGVKNMNALNSLYELQLQTSNQQMEATNLFLQNLQSSVEDSKKFQQQVANLAENLEALNSVYANMLNAMNPNK